MRNALSVVLVLVLSSVAVADSGPRLCNDLDDCSKKCQKGNGEACLEAGLKSDRGAEAGDDGSIARGFYLKACKRKSARGCLRLARSLTESGDPKLQKQIAAAYKQAVALFEKQCKKQKNGDACSDLASMYAAGMGVTRDEQKAHDYQERACQLKLGGPCPAPSPPPGHPQPSPGAH